MDVKYLKSSWALIIGLSVMGLCLLGTFVLFGSGLAFWAIDSTVESSAVRAGRPSRAARELAELPPVPTYTLTPSATPIPTSTTVPTNTPIPTATPTRTVLPTSTPLPAPTDTPSPVPVPPTAAPLPTDTPIPAVPEFPFSIKETGKFNTTHLNFDVFVAITDDNNRPLSGYRIVGTHDTGLQLESRESAGAWTDNSGAMHYKAGNTKYEALNSPSGRWTLQLVDADGRPVGPPAAFDFDVTSPTWYFLYYERQ